MTLSPRVDVEERGVSVSEYYTSVKKKKSDGYDGTSLGDIESALNYIPSEDRENWLKVGMALQDELGNEGYAVWDKWSRTAHNYNERDSMVVWRSFSPRGGITIATLFHYAKSYGWERSTKNLSASEINAHKQRPIERKVANDDGRRVYIRATATKATTLWERATAAPKNHPYLVRKCIKPHGVGVLRSRNKFLPTNVRDDGNVLVIPMTDLGGNIYSLQFISHHNKAMLAGKQADGLLYVIGDLKDDDTPVYLCEGFSTGASLHEDTGYPTVVGFSSGNLLKVGKILREAFFRKPIWVMADDDWKTPGNPGVTAATRTVNAIGGELIVPDFTGLDRGPEDSDYNDWRRLMEKLNGKA